jgi:hypothetical protein
MILQDVVVHRMSCILLVRASLKLRCPCLRCQALTSTQDSQEQVAVYVVVMAPFFTAFTRLSLSPSPVSHLQL